MIAVYKKLDKHLRVLISINITLTYKIVENKKSNKEN